MNDDDDFPRQLPEIHMPHYRDYPHRPMQYEPAMVPASSVTSVLRSEQRRPSAQSTSVLDYRRGSMHACDPCRPGNTSGKASPDESSTCPQWWKRPCASTPC